MLILAEAAQEYSVILWLGGDFDSGGLRGRMTAMEPLPPALCSALSSGQEALFSFPIPLPQSLHFARWLQ